MICLMRLGPSPELWTETDVPRSCSWYQAEHTFGDAAPRPHQQAVACRARPYTQLREARSGVGAERSLASRSSEGITRQFTVLCLFSSKPWDSQREDWNPLHVESFWKLRVLYFSSSSALCEVFENLINSSQVATQIPPLTLLGFQTFNTCL